MNFKQKLTTGMAAGTMLASIMGASAFAATDVAVVNNGNGSVTGALVVDVNVTDVDQTNNTTVTNNVNTTANTGGNEVSGNNGGGAKTVTTGNAVNDVTVENMSGNNVYEDDCGCPESDTNVRVRNNGNNSLVFGGVVNWNQKSVSQTNTTRFTNNVTTKAKTGNNKVKNNNGSGNKRVNTGAARNSVTVTNDGGSNIIR